MSIHPRAVRACEADRNFAEFEGDSRRVTGRVGHVSHHSVHHHARRGAVRPTAPAAPSAPVHALLDNTREPSEALRSAGMITGLSPREQADRIIASILAGGSEGPVLLCMPGTLGAAWQSSMLETAREAVRRWNGRGPLAVVSIPYNNGISDVVKRFVGIGTSETSSVLAMVIRGVHRMAPHRPILLAGESQGSWVIGHDLEDPELAAAVTRVALFSKPGFQKAPASVGGAAAGASLLPGAPGLVEWRHTDDIVPSLFSRIGAKVLGGYVTAFIRMSMNGDFEYIPHHYDAHGAEAAAYLLDGIMPTNLVHHSSDDM